MRSAYASVHGHVRPADWALATALFAVSLVQLPGPLIDGPSAAPEMAAVSLVLAAAVLVRRRFPVGAFAVGAVIAAAQIGLGMAPGGASPPVLGLQPSNSDVAILVLLYTLAAYGPRRISVIGLVVCLAGSAVAVVRWHPAHTANSGSELFAAAVGLGGVALAAWVLGDSVAYRYRRAYYASLEERAARLEAERNAQAQIAAAAERARELQERRARAVEDSAARLRRIERDLHDGAQVRLAALAMALGEIKENLDAAAGPDSSNGGEDDGSRTRMLVAAAHRNAKETLAELRDLARGIHPPVLDRGLDTALSLLAEASAIPVALDVSIRERPSPAIEAIAYFCAAELLANVTKHSGARHVTIGVSEHDGRLLMTVTDDGTGGAHLTQGGGLAGLLERVQTVDGSLGVDSPPGGPTVIAIELPGHA